MSSLWTDLLYLHGYLTDPKLARRLVDKPEAPTDESRHSREGGNPCCFDSQAKMDSRFRGNDGKTKARASRWYARLCLGIGDGALHWQ